MSSSQKTVAVNSTGVVMLWAKNPDRKYLTIQNQSSQDILVNIGSAPSSNNGLTISPGEEWSPVNPPKGDIRVLGIALTGSFQKLYTAEES